VPPMEGETHHPAAIDFEELFRRFHRVDQRHVGGLVAPHGQVHAEGRLAGSRDTDQDDVGEVQLMVIPAIVVVDGKLDRLDTGREARRAAGRTLP